MMIASLKRSFYNLNSMLLVVCLSYILEPAILASFFARSFRESSAGWLLLAGLAGLRVLYYGGIYGTILEVISKERDVLSRRRFLSNLREYWQPYVGLMAAVLAFHMVLFAVFPSGRVPFSAAMAGSDALVLLVMARIMVHRKYAEFSRGAVLFDGKLVGTVLVLTAINLLLWSLTGFDKKEFYSIHRVILFVLRYYHFFSFSLIAVLMLRRYPGLKTAFLSDRELVLINPLGGGVVSAIVSMIMRFYPAMFVVLKSLTPKDYQIREFNQVVWKDAFFAPGKLVAITCYTSNVPEAYRIAKEFRRLGSRVVMGGAHVSFFPEEALEYCDSVVVGDVEVVWPRILADYERGDLTPVYEGGQPDNYFENVYKLAMSGPPELAAQYLETGRGCKYNCDFCAIPVVCGKLHQAPLEQIIALVRKASGYKKTVMFFDNNIYADPVYARELFKALIPLNIKWFSCSSIDLARNDEDLLLARRSGCQSLLVGYEIAGPAEGRPTTGKFAYARDYRELSKKIKKVGISIKAHFILGFDHDTYLTPLDIWKFSSSILPWGSALSLLVPFPGTKLFDRMLEQDRLLSLNWRNYASHRIVFRPANMNPILVNMLYPPFYAFLFLTTSALGVGLLAAGGLVYFWLKNI